jgi:hypothetical protein
MKISDVKLTTYQNSVTLSARCNIRHFGADTVYFKFDKKYKDFIFEDASPFAACLLVPSMKLGEDLIIEGSISKKLYQNLYKIQKVFLDWDLGFKPINIKVSQFIPDKGSPKAIGSYFSGGVDSFYTYLYQKQTKDKVNFLILINGYDIELKNTELWKATSKTVDDIAQSEGIEVIKVESNIHDLIEPICIWDYTCGGCLAAVALSLRKGLKMAYLPGAYTKDQLFPAGEHPDVDQKYQTETFKLIHHGEETSRLNKTKYISKNPLVLKYLRVCYKNIKGKFNCGECDKCLRTMIGLQIAGTLHKSQTLPKKIDINKVRNLEIHSEYNAIFHRDNLKGLEKLGKYKELTEALKESLNTETHGIDLKNPLAWTVMHYDHLYFRGILRKLVQKYKQ